MLPGILAITLPISPCGGLAVLAAYAAAAWIAAVFFSASETPELRGAVRDAGRAPVRAGTFDLFGYRAVGNVLGIDGSLVHAG
jgi:hypothetical protein